MRRSASVGVHVLRCAWLLRSESVLRGVVILRAESVLRGFRPRDSRE